MTTSASITTMTQPTLSHHRSRLDVGGGASGVRPRSSPRSPGFDRIEPEVDEPEVSEIEGFETGCGLELELIGRLEQAGTLGPQAADGMDHPLVHVCDEMVEFLRAGRGGGLQLGDPGPALVERRFGPALSGRNDPVCLRPSVIEHPTGSRPCPVETCLGPTTHFFGVAVRRSHGLVGDPLCVVEHIQRDPLRRSELVELGPYPPDVLGDVLEVFVDLQRVVAAPTTRCEPVGDDVIARELAHLACSSFVEVHARGVIRRNFGRALLTIAPAQQGSAIATS